MTLPPTPISFAGGRDGPDIAWWSAVKAEGVLIASPVSGGDVWGEVAERSEVGGGLVFDTLRDAHFIRRGEQQNP